MDLAGITNTGIVGFKYFGFGGLVQDTKGIKAFKGAQKGDGTTLNLNLTPGGHGAFKIHVRIDNAWNGEEIAVIDVPADAPRTPNIYKVAVPAVEGLTGKHAIYLVAEGAEIEKPMRPQWGPRRPMRPQGLFDLHGIGFSKAGEKFEAPIVPQVNIELNGTKLIIPDTPIRFTNQNGYTDQTRYQVYGKMEKDGNVIKCTSSNSEVKFQIGSIVDGRCTIKATYNGLTKIFLIN